MKNEKKQDESEIYSLLAGTMDFFINDMQADQEASGDKNLYKDYLSEARKMKGKLNNLSESLKKP